MEGTKKKHIRNNKRGAALTKLSQSLLDLLLSLGVDRTGGLIQQHDGRLLEDSPGNRNAL